MPRTLPIVGRAVERAALAAAYASARTGQSQLLLLTGQAGIGKTRLVEDLCAAAADAQVLTGESAPLAGAALAYGPFVAALRDHAGWLLDDDQSGDMLAQRHRLFVRVLEVLTGLAAQAPVLLVLEDLHWADESSRELLDFLAVGLRAQPLMVVATLRDGELGAGARRWLAELERRPRVARLRLAPLTQAQIGEVVAELMPATASADARAAVISAAEGIPLYARELASAGAGVLPASITDAVLARAAGVTTATRAVIDQVSVADGGMSHELLAATVALSEERLLAAAREAVDSGLLASSGDGYSFTHALIRQVIYAQLLPGERRRLHRRFAGVLADWPGSDPGLLARHWHLAACPDRAAEAAVAAARHAVSIRAYPEAAKNYGLAIELVNWLPAAGPDLLEEAARAASWAGDPEHAAAWARTRWPSRGTSHPWTRARRLERLGRYRWEMGDPKAAVEATEQAMAILEHQPLSQLQARVLAALATRRLLLGEPEAALTLAARAVAVAQQTGADDRARARPRDVGDRQGAARRSGRGPGRPPGGLHARVPGRQRRGHRSRRGESRLPAVPAGRFAEAVEVAYAGRNAAAALDAPPAMTVRDRQQCRGRAGGQRPVGGSRPAAGRVGRRNPATNFTRYLQLLQLELAVGRGEADRAADLAATLRKSPDDPRLIGPCTPAWPSRR